MYIFNLVSIFRLSNRLRNLIKWGILWDPLLCWLTDGERKASFYLLISSNLIHAKLGLFFFPQPYLLSLLQILAHLNIICQREWQYWYTTKLKQNTRRLQECQGKWVLQLHALIPTPLGSTIFAILRFLAILQPPKICFCIQAFYKLICKTAFLA